MAGNFLKLYLSNVYSIGEVEMVSRVNGANLKYRPRMLNTEAKVYSTVDGETEIGSCGIITGRSDYIYYFRLIINCKKEKYISVQVLEGTI